MEPRPFDPDLPPTTRGARAAGRDVGGLDAWMTFGEAADLAEVPHATVAEWARCDALSVRRAWREGVEIRLVLARELVALSPVAGERLAAGWRQSERGSLDERAVFTGPRVSRLGEGGRSTGSGGAAPMRAALPAAASDEDRAWADELEREIARLRAEVSTLRSERDRLTADSAAANPPRLDASTDARAAHPAPRSRFVSEEGRGPSPVVLAFVGVCALVAGLALGPVLWGERGEVAHASEPPATAPDRPPGRSPAHGTAHDAAPTPGNAAEPAAALRASAAPAPQGSATALQTSAARVPAPEPPPLETPIVETPAVETPAVEDPVGSGPYPLLLSDVDAALFVGSAAVVDPCVYAGRVAEASDVRLALGPCFGPHVANGAGPAGSHRVRGVACCRHHAFVERLTSASRDAVAFDGLLTEAGLARQNGFLPALLRLRSERSVRRFLRARFGRWDSTAGAASGASAGDHWRELDPAADGAPRVELSSTMVAGADAEASMASGAEPPTRPFRLTLRLESGPKGDVLESFEWLDR